MDDKLIKLLKGFKKKVLFDRDVATYTKDNQEFYEKATAFIDSIPHYKKDFEALDWNQLMREHSALNMIATVLREKATQALKESYELEQQETILNEEFEIKEKQIEQKPTMKKEVEIKEGQMSLSLRGGTREGAGRKAIGIKKSVSISLPANVWKEIEVLIQSGKFESKSDFFRGAAGYLLYHDYG